MRDVRQRSLPPVLIVRCPGLSPAPALKLPSERWRNLMLRVCLNIIIPRLKAPHIC